MSTWPVLCLIIFLVFPIAWAEDVYNLNKIEILAWKDFQKFNLSDSDIVGSPPSNLSVLNILKDLPGLTIGQDGGPGGRSSVFIRGMEARHVVVTLDGLKLNDVSNVDRQFDFAFLRTPLIKEIVVYKGPQAVMLGSDAMGGAIELKTHKGEKAPSTYFQLMTGSFGTIDTSLRRNWKIDRGNSRGSIVVNRMRTEGISRLNKKRFNGQESDGAEVIQMSSSSEHRWDEKIFSNLLFSFLRGENELDGSQTDNSYDKSQNDQYILQQKTHYKLNNKSALSLRNGFNRHQRLIDTQLSGKNSFGGSNIENELLYRQKFFSQDYLLGVSNQHEEFKIQNNTKEFDVQSLFIQSSFDFNPLILQGGLRSEHHQKYGHFQTGSAGVLFKKNFHEIAIQGSQGYKAPSLYQLYAPEISGDPVGNQKLRPEQNNSFEVRWDYWDSRLGVGLNLYRNQLFDLITYSQGEGYLNQSAFSSQGAELKGKFVLNHFLWASSYTFQDFKDYDQVVLRRPRQTWLASMIFFVNDSWQIESKFRWYAHRFDLDPDGNTTKLNSFETVDFGLNYNLKKVSLGVRVTNIFAREYEELYGYSVMPRAYFLELSTEI